MSEAMQPSLYYMKGRSKHLFWGILAYLILLPLLYETLPYINPSLLKLLGSRLNIFFSEVFWITLMFLYGLKCNIKEYRFIFLILAALQLLNLVDLNESTGFIVNSGLIYVIPFFYSIIPALVSIGWVVCLSVVAFNKNTGVVLKISAILLGLYHLTQFGYVCFSAFAYDDVKFSFYQLSSISDYRISITTLFFAALSFTNQKPPKETQTANPLQVSE